MFTPTVDMSFYIMSYLFITECDFCYHNFLIFCEGMPPARKCQVFFLGRCGSLICSCKCFLEGSAFERTHACPWCVWQTMLQQANSHKWSVGCVRISFHTKTALIDVPWSKPTTTCFASMFRMCGSNTDRLHKLVFRECIQNLAD